MLSSLSFDVLSGSMKVGYIKKKCIEISFLVSLLSKFKEKNMKVKGIHLSWIVVKDLAKALEFYTQVVGLTVRSHEVEYGWAELSGPDGSLLGIAQENPHMDQKAGINAILTVSVEDISIAIKQFLEKGAKLVGDVIEVAGHVKMQTFLDVDGNTLQLVETLD